MFLDAQEDAQTSAGASPDLPPLRRSTRKRKSETDHTPQLPTHKGKRPRPLQKNMERTPTAQAKSATKQTEQRNSGRGSASKQSGGTGRTSGSTPTVLDPETAEMPPKGPEMMMFMGGMRAMMREELQKTEATISEKVKGLETSIKDIKGTMKDLEERVDTIDARIDDKVEELVSNKLASADMRSIRSSDTWISGGNFAEAPTTRDNRYWKARRSLRMWPIKGDGPQMKTEVLKFLATKLRMGEDVITDAEDCHIARVPANRNSVIKNEVVVEFLTVDLRDLVRKSAFNLAGDKGSGIRLEVPHHLMKNFKALESASYKLKQKYKGLKRNIKFDDERCDLVLEFKLHDSGPWKRLHPDQAKEIQRADGTIEEVSASDVTSLLDDSVDDDSEEC